MNQVNKTKKETKEITPEQMLFRLRQQKIALNFKKATGELPKTHLLKEVKKQIARLLTQQKKEKNNHGTSL